MTDPLTMGLTIGALVGGGSGFLFNAGGQSKEVSGPLPGTDKPLPPDPSTPATAPGSKPAQKNSQQQSFLSGAAGLQSAAGAAGGSSGSGGKSLLGQ